MQVDDVIDLIEAELEASEEGEPNIIKNIPSQDPDEELDRVEDDITGNSEDLDEEPDEEDDYPDQYDMGIASEMVDRAVLEQDSAYQTYFRGVMKKHGIKGIRGLSKEKRSEFFRDVSSGWKKHKKVKESKEIVFSEDYKAYFKGMMKKHGVKSLKNLGDAEKKTFFKKVDASWKAKSEQKIYEHYKKYFEYMMDECGIEDFSALNEVEQAEFMSLVNEAFQLMNEAEECPEGQRWCPISKKCIPEDEHQEKGQGRQKSRGKGEGPIGTPFKNELMQKPGAPIENPMSAHANLIDTMKSRLRPERRARQMAAAKQAVRPVVRR